MCRIGQNDRCKETGCEWNKQFGAHCHGEKIKTMTFPTFEEFMRKEETKSINQKTIKISLKHNPQPSTKRQLKVKNRRRTIWEKENGICYICGKPIAFEIFTIDHVIPVSKGGKNVLKNLKPTHKECNEIKGNKIYC